MRVLAVAVVSLGVVCSAVWSATKPATAGAVAFEPNRGQDPAGSDFVAHGKGYTLMLRADRAELVSGGTHVTTVLDGARKRASREGESPRPGVVNYLNLNDRSRSIAGIPTYGRVHYRGVYAGVDLIYYGNAGKLEYDFVVAPGADPHSIRMRYEGARSLQIDPSGDLIVGTTDGDLRQQRPVVYQEIGGVRREIAGTYRVQGSTVTFALARYDRQRPLVIDPVLSWATFLAYSGSPGFSTGEGVATDSAGNVYTIGTTVDVYGYYAVLISELNPSGANINTTYFDYPPYDLEGHALTVDSAGNIYFCGEITDFQSFEYAMVGKLAPGGSSVLWANYPDSSGNGQDAAYGVAIDSADNVYIAGFTTSTNFPVSTGVAQTRNNGGSDGFVAKYNSAGTELAATYLGGLGNDSAYAIAADASGDLFLTGATLSSNFPVTSGAFQSTYSGTQDAFVTKLSSSLTTVFSTYLGGNGADVGYAIAIDGGGAVYVTGETASTNFPTLGAIQSAFGGGLGDMFVTKLNGNGQTLAFSTYLGGSLEDLGNGIAVDASNNVYVTGQSASTDFPITSNAFQSTNQGAFNTVVAALNSSGGSLLFASYLGGNGSAGSATAGTNGDTGNAIATSCAAGLVVAGTTASPNFPVTSSAFVSTYPGSSDSAFVTRIGAGPAMPVISSGGVIGTWSPAAGPVAPGSLLSIYGSGFAISENVTTTLPLPTNVAGTTVSINGSQVPILYASANQMNVQVPYGVTAGAAVVSVGNSCGTSAPAIFQVAQVAPYILQAASGDAVAFNQDNTLNSPSNPAAPGSVITLYVTGIGPVSNPPATGAGASGLPLSSSTLPNSATIGGWNAGVYFLGLTPGTAGVAQADLIVPTLAAGQYAAVVTVNGVASNGPNVYVQ
jgi:uncharacterized protein (TIGR03437 family)